MGSKTDTYENAVLDHLVGTASTAMPTTVYSGLFTVQPSDSAAGTEVAATNYTRVATSFCTAGASVDGQIVNTGAVTFATYPSAYTIIGWALFATATGGTAVYWASVTTLAVGIGDQPTFAVGNITITED